MSDNAWEFCPVPPRPASEYPRPEIRNVTVRIMDEDQYAYTMPSADMPPENRISCALESLAVCQRIIGLMMARQGLIGADYMKFEMDMAIPAGVKRDKHGNVTVSLEAGS